MSTVELSVEKFNALLDYRQVKGVSFDVFDTLMTRTFAKPTDLFIDLGQTLQDYGLINVAMAPGRFGRLRVIAENQARLARADNEPNLAEIYAVLRDRLRWTDEQCARALQLEIDFERRSFRAYSQAIEYVKAARAKGCRIAFVSDMYLPAAFIKETLVRFGAAEEADRFFVSCEHRVSKAHGGIFKELEKHFQLPPSSILHVGDAEKGDCQVPRSLGFHTHRVRATQLGPIEKLHVPFSPELLGLPGHIAAASRNARLQVSNTVTSPALGEVGAGLLGPMLAAFALWTFVRAQDQGLERLYYVSRDGQVMRQIALAVQARVPRFKKIDCRYIYGSRIAWHHASLAQIDARHLRWMMDPQPSINAKIFARRLGVEESVVNKCLAAHGGAALVAQKSWKGANAAQARKIFAEHSAELLAAANAESRRQVAQKYFQQEGLFDTTPWGLVELGWSGSMLTSLCHALGRTDILPAFYFCQSHDDADLPAIVSLESFLMQPGGAQHHFGPHLRLPELIEALTAADHPTVLGYQEETCGKIGPTLKSGTIPMWPPDYLKSLRAGALAFVEALDDEALDRLENCTRGDLSSRFLATELLSVLSRFVEKPDGNLVTPFTQCVFSEDPAEEHRRTFVQPVSLARALKERVFTSDDLWPEGSLACSSGFVRALVTGGFGYASDHIIRQIRRRWTPFG